MELPFEASGYVHLRGVLDARDTAIFAAKLRALSGASGVASWSLADGVTRTPDFWPLIFNERVLTAARAALGPDIRYAQHSGLDVNQDGWPGWNRSNADRVFGRGADWDETRSPYRVACVTLFLGPARFGVLPGSHRRETAWTRLELKAQSALKKLLRLPYWRPPLLTAQAIWLAIEPGDGVIFSARLRHCSGPPRAPTSAISWSYGANDEHSRRHRRFYRSRGDYAPGTYGDYPPELARRLSVAGLLLAD